MLHQKHNANKIKKENMFLFVKFACFSIVMSLFITMIISFFTTGYAVADESYIPAPPSGPESGFIDTEYEYMIYTTNPDAFWMFDWGDGNYSDWVSLEGSNSFIAQSHSWSSEGVYHVRIMYQSPYFEELWSPSLDVNITKPTAADHPNKPSVPSGKTTCTVNISYTYSTSGTDDQEDMVQYRFDWGDGTVSEWTPLVASGVAYEMSHVWTHNGTYSVRTQTRDFHKLNSSWSDSLNVCVEADSDGDGLSDSIEILLGSNLSDSSDVNEIVINNNIHYIIFTSYSKNILFYNSISETSCILESNDDGNYLIDYDCDGKWDYIYDPLFGSIIRYEEPPSGNNSIFSFPSDFPWLWILIGIIVIAILLIILFLFKRGYIYFYDEYVIEE